MPIDTPMPATTFTAGAVSARRSHARYTIMALLAVGTMINYLDRAVLGIAAPSLAKDLVLSATMMGLVFSAFSWTYAFAQVPGGILLDRLGTKLTYFWSVTTWSLCIALHAATTGLGTLLGVRLGLGICEAPCFPTNSRVVGTWFPQRERARATSIYTVGEYVGLAFLAPVLYWIVATFGWRALFVVVGIAGLVFALVWWAKYREPKASRANQAELEFIESGGGLVSSPNRGADFSWLSVRKLMSYRQMWGACLGQFGGNSTLVFFLTWFPTYLVTTRHMGWIKLGFFAALPFVAASIGVLFGGWLSDTLLKRTGSANIARKLPVVVGLLLASSIIAANYVNNDAAVIAVLSLAFFAQGMAALGWTVISDIAPSNMMGLTGGIFNLAANLAGIVTPLVIGVIIGRTGSFFWALGYIAVVAVIGALSYIFILGDVRRLVITTAEA